MKVQETAEGREISAKEQFSNGLKHLKDDNIDKALRAFDKAWKEEKENPLYMSYYGMCKALRGGEIGLGLEMCTKAIKKEFFRAEFYVNLGKVYIAAGNKKSAIKIFKKGLTFDPRHEELNSYLNDMGFRKRPVIPFLDRSNPLNRFFGILFRRTFSNIFNRR